MICQKCHKREATVQWVGDGGMLAFSHGMYEMWCDYCCTVAQLENAKRNAARIPELERKLKDYELQK